MKGLGSSTAETKISTHLKLLEPWQIIGHRSERRKQKNPYLEASMIQSIMQILC